MTTLLTHQIKHTSSEPTNLKFKINQQMDETTQ